MPQNCRVKSYFNHREIEHFINGDLVKVKMSGWTVVAAGMGINLAFGVLYAWSVFAKTLTESVELGGLGLSKFEGSLPYMTAIAMFSLMMIPAGKLQDRFGPRFVTAVGGILTSVGLISASFFPTLPGLIFSFGVLAGSGIGLGYASTTPAAVKWFSPEKKGMITGFVVGGFGLAPLYIAPLTNYLIHEHGIFNSFRILGVAFLIVSLILSQLIRNPETIAVSTKTGSPVNSSSTGEMLKTVQFYQLWLMFFAGAMGGLMIIGHLSKIAGVQLGGNVGFILVALTALANSSGRPVAGILSDKIGRMPTMIILSILQGTTLFFFSSFTTFPTLLAGAAVVYFCYGAMLSVYPSTCSDFYGTKNLGINYGILFTAWGVGGVVGPLMGGKIADATGSYGLAFTIAACILFGAAVMGFLVKPYKKA